MVTVRELWHDARHPPTDPKDLNLTFQDKAVLVLGAHGTGLGHHAAVKYAALGANPLILAVRTEEKGAQAKEVIQRATNCSPDIFVVETVDLASFESVKALARRISERVPALHVVQLAAGVSPWYYDVTGDGHEKGVQVDVLAPALLALLLLPKMREVPTPQDGFRPHLSFLDSVAIFMVDEKSLPSPPPPGSGTSGQTLLQLCEDKTKWTPLKVYFLIKLATWFAVRGVANKAGDGSQVVVNATCPGLCKTNMIREMPALVKVVQHIWWSFVGRPAEWGARILVGATGLGQESHGRLWTNDHYHDMSPFLESERGEALYRETWAEIMEILRLHLPGGV